MPLMITELELPGILLAVPKIFRDERGFFMESYKRSDFAAAGLDVEFKQDNHSFSIKGVLRGLHYQLPPAAQGKLIRCARGAIWDVGVDIRRSSPSFGQWLGCELSAENRHMLYLPPGFAHGFITLSDEADVLYKTTEEYSIEHERAIRWDDSRLAIEWPDIGIPPKLSPKDIDAPDFNSAEIFE